MTDLKLTDLTMAQALQKLKSRDITAVDLTRAYLDRIKKYNDELNCYITVTEERAMLDAAESDRRYENGTARPLEGIPLGMKDLFCTKGILTTAASKILSNFIPEYESCVSQKLMDAGCVLLGKTNMDEFAMAATGATSFFGATINPHALSRKLTPGGSSSGSAAACAAGLCLISTGSDTGDSIRVPASFTGLVGMKPTYGLCSRYGCIAFASSLDTPGPIARTVDDCARMLSVMAGYDKNDSTSAAEADDIAKKLAGPLNALSLGGIRIGVISELKNHTEISPDMKKSFDAMLSKLAGSGAKIVDVSIPHIMETATVYAIISRAEASSNLSRYDGMRYGLRVEGDSLDDTYSKTRAAGFGDNVKMRLLTGVATLTDEFYESCFIQAAKVRRIIDNEFRAAFDNCDLIITPGAVGAAYPLDSNLSAAEADVSNAMLVGMNLAGLPACCVPIGRDGHGLPLGANIAGCRFDDLRVLQLAKAIEQFTNLDNKPSTTMGE